MRDNLDYVINTDRKLEEIAIISVFLEKMNRGGGDRKNVAFNKRDK